MEPTKVILTEEELNVAVKTYQKRLRLQDWQVAVHLVPQESVDDMACAAIRYHSVYKTALIFIPTAETYHGSHTRPQNMLRDLYHELIHLLFVGVSVDEGLEHMIFEQGIDILANALFSSRPLEGAEESDI